MTRIPRHFFCLFFAALPANNLHNYVKLTFKCKYICLTNN